MSTQAARRSKPVGWWAGVRAIPGLVATVATGALVASGAVVAAAPAAAEPAPGAEPAAHAGTDLAGTDAAAAPEDPVEVTVDAADIAADNLNGLTFKGFGTLTANSTSAVLMDYKAQHPESYARLIRVLFGGEHPVMNHVKIEMGNDRNNSTGPDPASMRWATEPANVTRVPGFQLAADAKKVNPDLKVSILRWNSPAWVQDNDDVYHWYKNTILAAYREYGYMVDYVNPGVNEQAADLDWSKEFSHRVRTDTTGYISEDPDLAGFQPGEAELFHQIETVISDEASLGTFGDEMVADADLREAVSVAGYHYNTDDDENGNFTRLAEEFDMEVWNSEAQATASNTAFRPNNNTADPTEPGTGIGGHLSALEMANTVIKGFVNSRRTHFIYQPAIGSFFEGGQYSFKELISARDPWSGWMHYDGGLAAAQHFSSFANTGWENADNSAGIWRAVPQASDSGATGTNPVNGRNGKPNYMTLAAPDGSDFSTVIVNDSEYPLTYRIDPEGFDLDGAPLAVWQTRAAEDGEAFNAGYKEHVADVNPEQGSYLVQVEPYSIATVTSLDVSDREQWNEPLPVEGERTVLDQQPGEGVLWSDDFDYSEKQVHTLTDEGQVSQETVPFIDSRGGAEGTTPLYTWDRNGAFEAYQDPEEGWVLRQQVDRAKTGVGGAWNGGDPITAIGDRRWVNYRASVDVKFGRDGDEGNYAALGARSSGGDNSQSLDSTPYVLRLNHQGTWSFERLGEQVSSGTIDGAGSGWHELSLQVAGGQISGWIDGEQVFDWTDPSPVRSGWVDLASGFHYTSFDNLRIERVPGYVPYYGEYLDNLEMNDLEDPPSQKLDYSGDWDHAVTGDMYDYQRSASSTDSAGADLSYSFTGSGLDILGANDGSARLKVTVDGELVVPNARTLASGQFEQTYALRGLPYGEHTVTVELLSGSLTVDAVGVIEEAPQQAAETEALQQALAEAREVERTPDHTDAIWAAFQRAIADAEAAVADPQAYRLDGAGALGLIDRLEVGQAPLVSQIVSVPDVRVATEIGHEPQLPETVTVTLTDGSERDIPVDWDGGGADVSAPWVEEQVTGRYGPLELTGVIEVIPADVVAFADVNGTADGNLGYRSPAFDAIAAASDLVNEKPDQVFDGTWGHMARNGAGDEERHYKEPIDGPYSKLTTTGMYTANSEGSQLSYTFTLPAGEYEVAAGSHSWWLGDSRTADVVLSYDGSEHVVDSVTLDKDTPSALLTYPVSLAEDGPVTITLRNTSGQSPLLSWVGVSRSADQSAPVTVETTMRCAADNAVVAATVTNKSASAVQARVATEFGAHSIGRLHAGDSRSAAFNTRAAEIEAGEVRVAVTTESGEEQTVTAEYPAHSCT